VIEESAVVLAVHGELAEVESRRKSACGSCEASGACGTSLLERHLGRRPLVLTVHNPVGAGPGDAVVVGIPEQSLLAASFAAYVFPLLTMVAGGICASAFAHYAAPGYDRGLSALGGALGLALGLVWVKRFSRAREHDDRYRAVILRRSAATGLDVGLPREYLQGKS
jgi:sigma-E factor negative regulatory protein RseC